jgi:hypothetical protein
MRSPQYLAAFALLSLIGCGLADKAKDAADKLGTAEQISACKKSCDKQRFFDCYDAAEQAGCYNDCSTAEGSKIEIFNACVSNAICDKACNVNIQPKSSAPQTQAKSDPPKDDPASCQAACTAYANDGCPGASACAEACSKATAKDRFGLMYCLESRNKCEVTEECKSLIASAVGPDPVAACQAGCDAMKLFSCIAPADQATCRDLCTKVDATKRDAFTACAGSGVCRDDACYKQLNPAGGSGDVSGCQAACDQMKTLSCIDADTHAACRTQCTTASSASIGTFKGCLGCFSMAGQCMGGSCTDASCYTAFYAAP